uniref:Citrate transporter-like domain-containing protein n=1 Tax=Haptolina brevifila TaxID=156173 RepID=A0A7S2MJP7_9EUKA
MAISAFMNNTPVCAMMIPIVNSWGASLGFGAQSLQMPLSFATMLGGTLTMIGSSTNLVAANAANKHDPTFSMNVFDITAIGTINALAGTAYMVLSGRKLLPQRPPKPAPPAATVTLKAGVAPAPPRGTARLWLTLALISTMMTVAAQQPKALLPMALGVLCVLVRTGCLTLKEAWSAVNGPVLLSIALSFALGEAIKKSDLAGILADKVVSIVSPYGELALLFAVYAVAITVGAVISNNAVVALMFPVVVRICEGSGISWKPALYALTLAASASFSTPVSYQTNLMVAADAGYSFSDFLRFGLPLQLVCMLATVPACRMLAK